MNRINLICLGVRDIKVSRAFYQNLLGFVTPNTEPEPGIVFFNNGGTKLELYPVEGLAKDINQTDPPPVSGSFGGMTLAYNAKTRAEVDNLFAKVTDAGGKIIKPPETVFWGGYSGYFTDPDGYYWEVAYADSWKFDDSDMLIIE